MGRMNDDMLVVFLPVWGKHVKLMQDFMLPSLLQLGNLPSLDCEVRVEVFTCDEEVELERWGDDLTKAMYGAIPKVDVNITVVEDVERADHLIIHGLRRCVKQCRELDCRMLVAMPDTVYGDESVGNAMTYARGRDFCVGSVYLRANRSSFDVGKWPCSNARLVDLAMKHLHNDNVMQFDQRHVNATYDGGMSMREIRRGLYTCVHHLPTVYLAYFDENDEQYWKDSAGWSPWDHLWPHTLVKANRLRVLGSSDLFFAVDLTDDDRPITPHHVGMRGNDRYGGRHAHNQMCGGFAITLRGEQNGRY